MKNFNFIKIFTKRHYIEKIKEKTLEFNKEFIQSNKTIIILFSLIFLYLCYLSVPALYNEQIIKSKLEDEISSSFRSKNIEFESFRYTFFPRPHFNIKNVIIKKEDSDKKIVNHFPKVDVFRLE